MFGRKSASQPLMMIRHDVDSLSCKAHKRSYKAFVKVHRGVGRVGEEKPVRAYLSTAMTRSFVVKYGRAAHSGVVIHIRWHFEGIGFGASMSVSTI